MIVFALVTVVALAQRNPPLRLLKTTSLPGFEDCDFDHFVADFKGNRLLLAAEGHKAVEVFDLRTGIHLRSITGLGEPHAVVYLADSNRFVVSHEAGHPGAGMFSLVSGVTYKITDTIKFSHDGADDAVCDPARKYCYVSEHRVVGAREVLLYVIDMGNFKHIGDITLPGNRAEAMAIEHSGNRLFVNLTGAEEVGVVDLKTRQVIARWPVPETHAPVALALDEANHRLFTAGRNPDRLIVFDTDSGKVVASLPCVGQSDDISYDAARKRVYVSGEGSTSVFEQGDADHYEHLAEIPTASYGSTSLFVPELNRLYIALSAGKHSGKQEPETKVGLMIFQTQP